MVDVFRASDAGRADRRRRHRHRRQGGVDAARRAQRRGRGEGRGGRARGDHEPLPEDRVRAAGRRAVLERRQLRHHPQPRRRGADRRAGPSRAPLPAAQRRLRLRDPGGPCRRRARPDHRRAHHADLPDHGLCVRRRRSRRLAVQPAQFRLHLLAPDQPDRLGAGGAGGQPGRRPRGGGRRLRPCRAVPGLLPPCWSRATSSSPRATSMAAR